MTCPIGCGGTALGSNVATTNSVDIPDVLNGNDMIFSLVLASSTIVQLSTCSESTDYNTIVAVIDESTKNVVVLNDDDTECPTPGASTVQVTLDAVSNSFSVSHRRRNSLMS